MENEKRLIDAIALKGKLIRELNNTGKYTPYECGLDDALSYLDEQPTIDAVEVVHGRWIEKEEKIWNLEKPIVTGWECSKCGEMYGHYTYNYCPNCGAKMDGDGNG